ncbi:MAG: hypothetical protein MHPSP_004300, partial [Paramarteilia canceri]
DHSGGNKMLKKLHPTIKIFGGSNEITDNVTHNNVIKFEELEITCLHTPCHTKEHICYFFSYQTSPKSIFTGDTLFLAGCGRFNEGPAEQMYNNLCKIIWNLPDKTNIFCGHEYTEKNLKFGLTVEPNNENIKKRLALVQKIPKENGTIPGTIEEEKLTNVFMRVK